MYIINKMSENILTKYLKIKNTSLPNKKPNRKKYKNKSKLIRTSCNRRSPITNYLPSSLSSDKKTEILKTQINKYPKPPRVLIKKNRNQYKRRKSPNTSKKDKKLKAKYFEAWCSKPHESEKPNISSSISYDSSILNKLASLNTDNLSDDEKKNKIKAMRFLLTKIKEDNKRIEQLLQYKLNEEQEQEQEQEEQDVPTIYKCIKNPMTTIKELIEVGNLYEKYKDDDDIYFNIDLKAIYNLQEPLKKLDKMVGLNDIKKNIAQKITFYIQHLENKNNDFLHTLLYGSPGTGKTELGHIIGKIYSALGFLSSDNVIIAHADDFIGSVVGQTALKTRSILDKAVGGVLIIDEAYALGSKDGKSYVDDFINTLLPFLTEHRSNFVCILMGYKKDIEDTLLNRNKGLRRRFPNSYELQNYNMEELRNILITKINEYGWYYETDAFPIKLFNEHKNSFKNNGGSMENLFKEIKIAHAQRVLYYPPEKKKTINSQDFKIGLRTYTKSVEKNENKNLFESMYM